MSYDIEIYSKKTHHLDNYTSNVGDMYNRAYRMAQAKEKYLKEKGEYKWLELTPNTFHECFNSKDRERTLRALKLMIEALEGEPEWYKSMNPENGWGNYEGAVKFLRDAYITMLENPKSLMEFDY